MKMLSGFLLCVALAGCIPIGIQGRTSAIDAPPSGVTARSTSAHSAADYRGVSA